MLKNASKTRARVVSGRIVAILFFFFSFLLILANPRAGTDLSILSLNQTCERSPAIPAEYGEVIFRCNETSPNQIFIVGMSHRDTLTRSNGSQTSRVQAEVYKIGDWLIHNEGLQLLLPEGFFKSKPAGIKEVSTRVKTELKAKTSCSDLADFKRLQQRLSDDVTFVNAEMLLNQSHPMRLKQVEDWALYESVNNILLKLVSNRASCDDSLLPELDYLQDRRVAAMLQRIPEIVDDEFRQKAIKEKKAIFTIGMMHVHTIIQYLNNQKIAVHAPASASVKSRGYTSDLKLLKENFGISVILPRTLAANQEILKINHLDRIVARPTRDSSGASPSPLH